MESPDSNEKKVDDRDLDDPEPNISHEVDSLPTEDRPSLSSRGSLLHSPPAHPSSDFSVVPSTSEVPGKEFISANVLTSEMAGKSAIEEVAPRKDMGTTKMRHEYDQVKSDYEASSKQLHETVIKSVINLMEIHKTNGAPSLSLKNSESTGTMDQLKELEKEVKAIGRRIAESRREQAFALSEINNLELRMMKEQEAALIRELLDKIPTEEDMKKISRVQVLVNERRQFEKEIEKLKSGVNAMNKAMANVDVVISDFSAMRRQRKVVIQDDQADDLSRPEGCSSINECKPESEENNSPP